MFKVFVLLGLSLGVSALVLPATDSRIYYTEHNWYADPSGFLETVNAGAYIKVGFNGSSFTVNLDDTFSKALAVICWSVDGGPEQNYTLPGASKIITIATGLKKDVTHSLYLFLRNHVEGNRWFNPATRLRIMSVSIDDDAVLFTPKLAPKRLLAYWDSIGEGAFVNGDIPWQYAHDAHLTWAFSLALGLNAELSLVAFGAQGYTKGGSGNSPRLYDDSGLCSKSAWGCLSAHYKRTFATCPDYIINGHGTNDGGACGGSESYVVYQGALEWLKAIRGVCPKSQVFLTVPFGQFCEATLVKAYNDYQAKASDPLAHLIQMGEEGSAGLQGSGPSFASVDGLHPWGWKSSQLGALLVAKITPFLNRANTLMEL